MLEKHVKILESTGLTHAQAIVYLTTLELGQSKVGTIIERTGLQSSVVHNCINQLIDKGLVNFLMIGKIKQYNVADPSMFTAYLEEQKKQLTLRQKEINEILPTLKAISEDSKQKTEVEVYKGKKGLKTAFLEEYNKLPKGSTLKFIALPEQYHHDKEVQDFFNTVNTHLFKKKCKIQGLGPSRIQNLWKNAYKNKGYSFKYIDEDFPFDINIFKDTILVSLWGDEPIVIRIKDKRFREHSLKYFEQKWKQAKK